MSENIDELINEFPGYHLEITIHPAGGIIDAMGCEECGGDENKVESVLWGFRRQCPTFADAKEKLKKRCFGDR